MSPQMKFFIAWYGSAVAWDVRYRDNTVSHAVAALLAGKWSRWPVTAVIAATVVHLFALASEVNRQEKIA